MKRQIVIEIDCDDERCGDDCALSNGSRLWNGSGWCSLFGSAIPFADEQGNHRCNPCLAAERKLTALIAAGTDLRHSGKLPTFRQRAAWDAALAVLKEEGR